RTGKIILQSVHRSQGIPAYRGSLELLWTEGGMVLVNELPLEEYLYSVVPSEMPASYPQEALKAQAICARTYAYTHMQRAGYEALGAHVDDSSSYQVYNNILEQEEATAAVKATYGQLLVREDGVTPAETYYYSTSWGYGSDAHVWKTSAADSYGYIVPRHLNRGEMGRVLTGAVVETAGEAVGPEELTQEEIFAAAIRSTDPGDFEAGEGWYRWTYTVKTLDPARILERLQDRCDTNDRLVLTRDGEDYVSSPVKSFREIRNLTVLARGAGGVADELLIETDQDTYKVISENTIRYVLCDGETLVRRQDGSQVAAKTLLPSAFFTIEIAKEGETVVGYNLTGGGFGHGVGMSQNGARSMAAEGYGAGDILRFFYEGCSVKEIYYDGEAD
ncbi:MAG: SpoIID/LytB domain-containing protein, partial [Lachnospiraceae bacterium]|nr:SpoIID/LytB domain-containing protein [Lachnospiraceae bacterium]